MALVNITGKKFEIDGRAIPFLSGEVHYWRMDPETWEPALLRARELGLEIISTYVCWDFHQTGPGKFDFGGETNPRRNLTSFLELLTRMGFWIILRPGPYIYSEWKNNGVPDEAARLHRLSPEFQALAKEYMQAVTAAARPYLATNGGRIILWQADNEIDPWPHWYTEELGLGNQPGVFQEYLAETYGNIGALNRAWDSSYTDFAQARGVTCLTPERPELTCRYLDYARFQHWYVNQTAQWAKETYCELGVDVPIYLNAYSGVGTQSWAEMEALCDLAGPDIYPSRELSLRPNELRTFLEAVRFTRTYSCLPHIAEFEAGIWHDWLEQVGVLPPNHYRLICLAALLAGAAGWNWYMLVNRDNWYQCPINERGLTRPDLYETFRQIIDLYKEIDPTTLEKVTPVAVTFDPLQRATQRPGQELLQSLYQADVDYEFFDVSRAGCDKPILFYAGGTWLSRQAQANLKSYVEQGGHLVCIGASPSLDDRMQPANLLEVLLPEGMLGGFGTGALVLDVLGGQVQSATMANYAGTPGTPITARRRSPGGQSMQELELQNGLQSGNAYTVGYSEPRGKGRLTVLGLQPTPELIRLVLQWSKTELPSRACTEGIATALFGRGGEYTLMAVNNGEENKTAEIELNLPAERKGDWMAEDLVSGKKWRLHLETSASIMVSLPRKDGTIVRITEGTL